MAGSFGFESEKYNVSLDIGERVLLPAVRKAAGETLIVADGFSCREQIAQETHRHALHLAEVIQMAQKNSSAPAVFPIIESEIVNRRKSVRRRARNRALIAVVAALAGGFALKKIIART
jgi:nucleoside-triphosphatase THEP1